MANYQNIIMNIEGSDGQKHLIGAPVEIWLGCLLQSLPQEWFTDIALQVKERMTGLRPTIHLATK